MKIESKNMPTPLERIKATMPPSEQTMTFLGGGMINVEQKERRKKIAAEELTQLLSGIADRGKTCAIVSLASLPLLREKYHRLLPDVVFDSLTGFSIFTYQSEEEQDKIIDISTFGIPFLQNIV